jgi:O-antigen/teichoic acid export membrane protein
MVQFARISNSQDTTAHLRQTLFLIKISAAGTIAGLSFFLFCPAEFFAWLFGPDFYPARQLILYLSPGILLVAITSIISSYFSGSGKIWINTIGSFIGLVLAVIITAPLVHSHQLPGAALSNTLVYTGAFLVSLVAFVIIGKLKPVDFLPGKEDGEKLRLLYQRLSGKA